MGADSATVNLALQRISGNMGEARFAANDMTTLNNVTVSSSGTPVTIKGVTESDVVDNMQLVATLTSNGQQAPPERFSAVWAQFTEPLGGTGLEVERATPTIIRARLLPSGFPYHHVDWQFSGGQGGTRNTGTNPSTTITMVDGAGFYTVRVRFFEDELTPLCFSTLTLSVGVRTGNTWKTTPSLAPDNEPTWGALPTVEAAAGPPPGVVFGEERDQTSNLGVIIRPNPFVPGEVFSNGYNTGQVNDPAGPNHEYWYIKDTSLFIERETVINQYIKSGGPPPALGQLNFYNYNNGRCINSANFVRAVMGHENSGANSNATGHYGLLVTALQNPMNDPRTVIEDNFATPTEGQGVLIRRTTDELSDTESALVRAIQEANVHGNWSASNKWAMWSTRSRSYTGCVFGRDF
jgi:hypothetical protein